VQYTRNMATGASTADLAIILVDAKRGLTDQSRRHASIAALLGIHHFVIAVNKMDLIKFDYGVFDDVFRNFKPFLDSLRIVEPYFLPMSALLGDNVVERSANMPWFVGAPLLEHLESIEVEKPVDAAFRMAVQRAVRPDQTFRGYAGQIASGVIRPGDEILALPSGRRSRVARIVTYDGDLEIAHAPLSVTLTLEDEIDISRGDMLSAGAEPQNARSLEATVVWFDETPLDPSKEYLLKHTTQTIRARIETDSVLKMNDIGEVRIALPQPLFFDAYKSNRITGSFILIDRETNATAAAGMIQ
jgi:sulfate adenylyltransferase large subunit